MESVVADVIAALHFVILNKDMGFSWCNFGGDTLQIVQEINSESPTLSTIGHFVESTRQELGLLRSFSIVHIKREANSEAHGFELPPIA